MTQDKCLPDAAWQQYLANGFPDDDVGRADRHLEACPHCRTRLEDAVAGPAFWNEAKSHLADWEDDRAQMQTGERPTNGIDPGLIHYLTRWFGPTDDPTKLGKVGPYEVMGIVGHGGSGIVLKAHDMRLNRYVAIKVLLPTLAHNSSARRRFERESRAVAAISNAHVIPIYSVDVYNDHSYFAMQYVAGTSLQQRIDRQGPLKIAEIVRIAAQIARALAAAHALGIVHRDIKPANVLLEQNVERVLVTDFGLARVADEAATQSGIVAGTPQYMSPEQCRGDVADSRSDLFSLGSVMYVMCTGRPPFRADTIMGLLRKVCEATPHSPRELNPEVPLWLEVIVKRLMMKSPEQRFASADEVAVILEGELAHLQNPTAVAIPARKWMRAFPPFPTMSNTKRRFVMMIASVTVVVTALLASQYVLHVDPDTAAQAEGEKPKVVVEIPFVAKQVGKTIYESNFDQTFKVEPGGTLRVESPDGKIKVVPGKGNHVHARVFRKIEDASTEKSARELLEHHDVTFESKGNDVTINAKEIPFPNQNHRDRGWLDLTFEVEIPEQFNVELMTHDGEMQIERIVGTIMIKHHDGDCHLDHISGCIKIESADGNISNSNCTGSVFVRAADGNVNITGHNGPVEVVLNDGDVRLSEIKGEVKAKMSDGNCQIEKVIGPIKIEKTDGDILVKDCEGIVNLRIAGGNVTLDRILGEVAAVSGSGNIHLLVPVQPIADISLTNNDGNVTLSLFPEISAELGVILNDGHVETEFNGLTFRKLNLNGNRKNKRLFNTTLGDGKAKFSVIVNHGNLTVDNESVRK